MLQPEPLSPQQATTDLFLHRKHSNTQRQVWLSLCGGSLGTGAHKVLFGPSEHFWWVWGLILNMILPILPSFVLGHRVSFFFLWDPKFSCWWLFSSELQFCRFLLCHLVRGSPEVTGKFGLAVQNEGGQRLTEFCQENTLVIADTIFGQHKGWLYTWTLSEGQYWNQTDYILCSRRWRSPIQSA